MAKNEIFSYRLVCFWNGNCWLCWHLFMNGLSFLFFLLFFLISGRRPMESLEPLFRFSEHSKRFAPICEGATFAWRITTTSLSRTWNLFLLDERKSNRGVRMCRRSSQRKIKLIFNTRKGYYTNQFLLKRWQANFNLQFVYAALKYASQLGLMIGDTWKCKLHNEYASIKLIIAIAKCQRAKMLPIRARCWICLEMSRNTVIDEK